ncbi:MAG: hypothetical protein GWN93_24840 [Deltaproteobacteria bacterium]|nr:hypothetical protein [Deltaproteobacteria bacterium]
MFRNQKEKNRYIDKVWERLEARYLQVFPFLTDGEFRELFGDKTIQILEKLDCPNEGCGQCDFEIDCPYYSQMLDRCGINPYKPVHCRLWHCYDCGPEPLIKQIRELTGIFSDQLGPESEARRIKDGLEEERISRDEAERRFRQLIEEFRNISPDSS